MKKFVVRLVMCLFLLSLVLGYVPAPVYAASIQDGVTLHCWNWSFKNIESNMATIARSGYTAIQVSPIQQAKQKTAGYQTYDWWVFYQPASFSIDNTGNSALGTKAQFRSMCQTAHSYGIKVIVDVVANHMGDNGGNNKSPAIIADIRNDPSCWHDISKNTYDYWKRYDVTQWCMDGLPDLNTGSPKVQNYVLGFLKECIDAGADGFRFDAAKHIETPEDGKDNCASNFWPTVVNGAKSYAKGKGIDLYCYGELLDSPGGNLPISAYTKYMSVTDNTWSNDVRNQVVCGGNAGAYSHNYHKGSAEKLVLWAESHDNYAGDGSNQISVQNINKAWALVAARADAMSLYLARPNGYTQKLGTASTGTGWANKEVAAVNKFHTAFAGKSEYVASEGSIAYVQRGDSGVVLVNCSGMGQSVNVTNHTLKNGTYTDQISGNTFTVSGGRIRGTIGSTGIAVVYQATPEAQPQQKTIYFTNSANWSKVNIYSWYTESDEITASWPGDAMTKVSGNVYSAKLPADASNVIFNNGSTQTADLIIPSGKNHYDFATGKWSVYTTECTHATHNQSGNCTSCGKAVGHRYGSNGTCVCGAVCPHASHRTDGVCNSCGKSVSHRYVNGVCGCGAKAPQKPIPETTQPTPTPGTTQPGTVPTLPPETTPNATQPKDPTIPEPTPGATQPGTVPTLPPETTVPEPTPDNTQPKDPTTPEPTPHVTQPEEPTAEEPTRDTAPIPTKPNADTPTPPKSPLPIIILLCGMGILIAVGIVVFVKIRKSK